MTGHDVLLPKEAGQFIANHSKYVFISSEAVTSTAVKVIE